MKPRILLIGCPNCGKSTLFNALTGGHAKTGNWHGVTVAESVREAELCGLRAEIADLPGVYSLGDCAMEERAARDAVLSEGVSLAVCVADAAALPRSLELLAFLVRRGKRAALVLTMRDVLERRGGFVKEDLLAERLGVPVLAVCAHQKQDIARLRRFLHKCLKDAGGPDQGNAAPPVPVQDTKAGAASSVPAQGTKAGAAPGSSLYNNKEKASPPVSFQNGTGNASPKAERGALSGGTPSLLAGAWAAGEARQTLSEKLLYTPAVVPLFFVLLAAVFYAAFGSFGPGAACKGAIERLFAWLAELAAGGAEGVGAHAAAEFLRALLGSAGMLLSFLPQIAVLQFSLSFLEESGFLSALAFQADGLLARVGLTGRAVFPLLMGFGCTAAAVFTTRGMENERVQRRVVCILPYISCSAKLPVYLAVCSSFFEDPFAAVAGVYAAGVLLALAAALVLRKGEDDAFVFELARPQLPALLPLCKSLLFSLKQFIMKIATVVAAFLMAAWFLLSFSFSLHYVGAGSEASMLAAVSRGLRFLFVPMGIDDWRIALAALSGLIAKENVAGMLSLFYGQQLSSAMSVPSAVAFLAFLLACTPCVSALAAARRAVGRRAWLYAAAQTGIAFLLSYAVYGLLRAGALAACIAACAAVIAAAILLFWKERHAKVYRAQGADAQRLHRRNLCAGLVRLFAPLARKRRARQRAADGQERHARCRRRSRLLHHPARRGKALLRYRL